MSMPAVLRTIAGTVILGAILCAVIAGGGGFILSVGYLWLRLTGYGYNDYYYCLLTGMPIVLISFFGFALIYSGYLFGNDFLKNKEK